MKVSIDADYCQAHGSCAAAAPGLIELDDEGYPVVLLATVPDDQLENARLAARNCPEGAVTLD